jgi:hypothetical protein
VSPWLSSRRNVGSGRIAGELVEQASTSSPNRQAGATAVPGGAAQDAGRKLFTTGCQMLLYTAGHLLDGPYSSMA